MENLEGYGLFHTGPSIDDSLDLFDWVLGLSIYFYCRGNSESMIRSLERLTTFQWHGDRDSIVGLRPHCGLAIRNRGLLY